MLVPLGTWWPECEWICAGLGGASFPALSVLPVSGRGPQLQSVPKLASSGCTGRGGQPAESGGWGVLNFRTRKPPAPFITLTRVKNNRLISLN